MFSRKSQAAQAPRGANARPSPPAQSGRAAWGNDARQAQLGLAAAPAVDADEKERQEGVLDETHGIANQDIVLEQLAHRGAYGKLDPRKLAAWGYREGGATQDPESGFRAVLYLPTDAALSGVGPDGQSARAIHGGAPPPVLAFRGTSNQRGVADDANRKGVGTYQFASNEGRVQEMLAAAGGKVVVAGHSLGGALAQLAATHFPSQVSRVVTFQSPGIEKEEADKLDAYNRGAAPEDKVRSTHHRADKDLVHMAGEALTDGDVYTFSSKGLDSAKDHLQFPLARLAAARGGLVPGVEGDGGDRLVEAEKTTAKQEKKGVLPKASEGVRKLFGGLVRDDSMESYVRFWADVKAMIESGRFGEKQVLGVIADARELTPDQKVKMRDQATKLLAARV